MIWDRIQTISAYGMAVLFVVTAGYTIFITRQLDDTREQLREAVRGGRQPRRR